MFRDQRDGHLIHISSSAAKKLDASGVGYLATKAGVAALAHATMMEERANGVRPTPPTRAELDVALQPDDVAQMCLAVMTLPARVYVPELCLYPSQR